jgi:hypothetical protein
MQAFSVHPPNISGYSFLSPSLDGISKISLATADIAEDFI